MTRLEKAMQITGYSAENIMMYWCPASFNVCPDEECDCDNMTHEECWNVELEEE